MTTSTASLAPGEQNAIISLCALAAFADGRQSEVERAEIRRIAGNFARQSSGASGASQPALGGGNSAADHARGILTENGKALAYEMAVCVCNVDGALLPAEKAFLEELRRNLNLSEASFSEFQHSVETLGTTALAAPPILTQANSEEAALEDLIRNRAILAGALELMPQTLATMAIVPVQIQMVYQIGKTYGHTLDASHASEFLATIGVGLTSQLMEGYVTKLVQGVARRFTGKMMAGVATQATGSALAFVTTYAIGQAAKAYYSSGRTLSSEQIQNLFSTMLNQGRALKDQYSGQILDRSRSLNVADLLPLVKSS